MKSGIYKITCLATNKFYIGSAVKLANRFAEHKTRLRANTHHNQKLQRAYNKYWEHNFKFEVIEYCAINELINREQIWIDKTNCCKLGYNICFVGRNNLETKRSKETCEKISKSLKGRKVSEEMKKKISKTLMGRKGQPCSEERKRKVSLVHKNKIVSIESRNKMSQTRKGKPWSANRRKSQKIPKLGRLNIALFSSPTIII